MDLFRGYVPTKNKACTMKFKGVKELMKLEEVEKLPEYAGILSDDIILIDIDDHKQSEIMMQIVENLQLRCRVYETTRGKHFFFRNSKIERCRTHCKLAIGIEADIKLGKKSSYAVLKFKDKSREIIYDILDGEEYEELPKWMTPIQSKTDFLEMEEGDGRNQALFNYILTLQSNDFSKEEARQTLRIINQYILKSPLSPTELETIFRDESFKKPVFFKDKTFLFDKFAVFLKNNHNIIRINNQLHIYRDGIYVSGYEKIEAEMINHIPNLSRAKRTEVMAYLELLVTENQKLSSANFIAFKNGVLDLDTGEIREFSPDTIVTNKINFNYNPAAYSELADKTLNKLACHDKHIRMLLEEVIGYCFYRRNELRKAFILTGGKANGKSSYLDMIKTLLGDDNTSALDLKELSDRFKTAELFGKLANIGDDIEDEFIPHPATFKKLVSGDPVNAERKGHDPFDFSSYAKLIFSANTIPRIKDKSGAVIDRLIIVPFDARFSNTDPDFDPYIKYKLREEACMEYLIRIGIEGLKRVLKNHAFTQSARIKKELEEYEKSNNPILFFFDECGAADIINETTAEIYKKYQEFCINNNFQPMSNIEFSRQVTRHFHFETVLKKVNGKNYRVFIKNTELK